MPAASPIVALQGGGTLTGGPAQVNATVGASMNDYSTDSGVGTGSLTGAHNAPLHVGGLIILALATVIVLRALGFRFVVGANIASGIGGG